MENREGTGTLAPIDPTESGTVHLVEYEVHRRLLAAPDLDFHSLVIRRVPGGIQLDGTVEGTSAALARIADIVASVAKSGTVFDHLVVHSTDLPAKG